MKANKFDQKDEEDKQPKDVLFYFIFVDQIDS